MVRTDKAGFLVLLPGLSSGGVALGTLGLLMPTVTLAAMHASHSLHGPGPH